MSPHRVLHGMQRAVARGEVFHGEHFRAVSLAGEQDARIDRRVYDAAAFFAREDDRARAAVALRAAFLGSDRAIAQAQPVEQRHPRVGPRQLDGLAASDKPDNRSH